MNEILRSSETYVVLVGLVGIVLVNFKVVSKAEFDSFLAPAMVYVVSRLISKAAKSTIPPAAPKP